MAVSLDTGGFGLPRPHEEPPESDLKGLLASLSRSRRRGLRPVAALYAFMRNEVVVSHGHQYHRVQLSLSREAYFG